MGLKTYSKINSFFNSYDKENRDFFEALFLDYPNIDILNENKDTIIKNITDFFNSHCTDNNIDAKSYIEATINQFLENKPFGQKKLTSLENLLKNEYLNMGFLLKNEGYLYKYINPYISQVKIHTFLWHYYANRTEYKTYKETKIIIPAGFFNDRNLFNFATKTIQEYEFNRIGIKKRDIETFDGKWQMNDEWIYAKRIINKYFYKVKNIAKEQKVKKIYKTPIGDFFKTEKNLFFYGKTEQFIKLFKK